MYQAGLISTSCIYPGCTCPASANLMSFTRHYLSFTRPEKKDVHNAIESESTTCQCKNS